MSLYSDRRNFPVKNNRHSDRAAAPFGSGILRSLPPTAPVNHDYADEVWAAQAFSATEGWWADSREMEEAAQQAAWEEKWDATLACDPACAMCGGRESDGAQLTGGLCDRCNFVLDADLDIDGSDDLRASDMVHSGNQGYRARGPTNATHELRSSDPR